jgi:ankyrin repeat protein
VLVHDPTANVNSTSSADPGGVDKAEDVAHNGDEQQTEHVKAIAPAEPHPVAAADGSTPELENAATSQETAPMAISPGDEQTDTPETETASKPTVLANGKAETTPEQKSAPKTKKKRQKFYCPHNINERDNDENTPLHIAIHARKLEQVRILCEAGASAHKKCDGSPPVHTAISMGSLGKHSQFAYDCVVVLSENGADLTAKDDSLHTPLYLACMYNLPQIVGYILANEAGLSTLNSRADRSQGRALHAAAKFDALSKMKIPPASAVATHARIPQLHHHHPDGSIVNARHHIPGFPGKPAASEQSVPNVMSTSPAPLTQILLGAPGIEIDATNTVGQTPLHVACSRGNWAVARMLLQAGARPEIADRRGFTPGQIAHKRGMPIPNEMLETLGGPPSSGTVAPPRDLIVDPDSATLLLTHELCGLHRTCPIIRRDSSVEPPPENVRRLHVLVDNETGILRSGEFGRCKWENETRRAAIVDVLKVCGGVGEVSTGVACPHLPFHSATSIIMSKR